MTDTVAVKFPCDQLPEDPGQGRLLGIYPQRQDGMFMQRVRIPGGRLSAGQWRALGSIARDLTPSTPLHLTTRQDVEIHDLSADQIPLVHRRLADGGLTAIGACGDTLRNITVCPCSGVEPGTVDLLPLALEIQRTLWDYQRIFQLPRKFKISLSACSQACGQPWINDLGLVASREPGPWGFQVIGAGSLGPRPASGVLLFQWLSADDVLPLVLAAVRLFDAHGDRERRAAARLRHVRQRVGDQPFLDLLRAEFDAVRSSRPWPKSPDLGPSTVAPGPSAKVMLTFANGDIQPDAADALGELAARPDLAVRITNDHQVAVFGPKEVSSAECQVSSEESSVPTWASTRHSKLDIRHLSAQPCVVTCPGSRWCKRAVVNTCELADRIRDELADRLRAMPAGQRGQRGPVVRISGCPNGCAQNAVAEIGLVGRVTTVSGQRQEAFDIVAGGELGRGSRMADLVEAAVPANAVPQRLATLLGPRPGN